jgi:hypothetical protein
VTAGRRAPGPHCMLRFQATRRARFDPKARTARQ